MRSDRNHWGGHIPECSKVARPCLARTGTVRGCVRGRKKALQGRPERLRPWGWWHHFLPERNGSSEPIQSATDVRPPSLHCADSETVSAAKFMSASKCDSCTPPRRCVPRSSIPRSCARPKVDHPHGHIAKPIQVEELCKALERSQKNRLALECHSFWDSPC